jgi:hypothetical protein
VVSRAPPQLTFVSETNLKHMINIIPWQHYWTAVITLTAAWYLYTGLRYYRSEVFRLLHLLPKPQHALPDIQAPHAVMGTARPDEGTGLHDPEELIFSGGADANERTRPRGPAEELLAEAETLMAAFGQSDDKNGFLGLLRVLISGYSEFAAEIGLPGIISSLKTTATHTLSFQIRADEWPITFTS